MFLASTALTLVFWAVTPLQSALLATGVIDKPNYLSIANVSQLMALSKQSDQLSSHLRGELYFTAWLDIDYPPFTTPEYALLPFHIYEGSEVPERNGNISAVTTKLWVEVECSPARTVVGEDKSPSGIQWDNSVPVYVANDAGCNATVFPKLRMRDGEPSLYMDYWGSYKDGDDDYDYEGDEDDEEELDTKSDMRGWELASRECPDVQNQFVAAWMEQTLTSDLGRPKISINATWCKINYYKQRVRATLDAKSLKPLVKGMTDIGDRERLSDNDFNTTAFEKFLRSGRLDRGLVDTTEQYVFQHEPWLYNHSVEALVGGWMRQIKDPVGYALAVDMNDVESYADPEALATAYDKAWKRQFALSVRRMTTNSSSTNDLQAVVEGPMTAIIVSRSFATAVEVLLLTVAVINFALLWACRRSKCNLQANPSSVRRLDDVAANSPAVINLLTAMDTFTDDELSQELKGSRFRLSEATMDGKPAIEIVVGPLSASERPEGKEARYFESTKPIGLNRGVGFAFLMAILGGIAGLAYLKAQELAKNGTVSSISELT